jgi:Tfp pilus assembly major pilin PilA
MGNPHLKWIHVPSKPTKLLTQLKHDEARKKYYQRIAYRNEYLRQIGLSNSTKNEIRICNQHGKADITISYKWVDMQGVVHNATLPIMTVPSSTACKSNLHVDQSSTKASGTAYDRSVHRHIKEIKNNNDNSDLAISMIQSFEREDGRTNEIHPSIAEAGGITCHPEVVATNLNYRF